MQHKAVYLLFCKFILHVPGVKCPTSGVHKTVTTASGTFHIFCAATSLQSGQDSPDLATEVGSCTKNMTRTGGCSYSFV